jgi:hypothetical protein
LLAGTRGLKQRRFRIRVAAENKLAQGGISDVTIRSKQTVFVVPFFYNGGIQRLRVYSDVMKAQAALRRYVGFKNLLERVRQQNPKITAKRAVLDAYGAIERTPYAGSFVYEVEVDDPKPIRRQRLKDVVAHKPGVRRKPHNRTSPPLPAA